MAGRHRKPTHHGRTAATITASGAFLLPAAGVADARVPTPEPEPVSSSTGASDTTRVLDAIADCESSGNPRAFNGIAHYGLFQFDLPTYRSVGGTGNPRDASVAEQYRRAAALLAQRGTQPWNASRACWSRTVDPVAAGVLGGSGSVSAPRASAPRATVVPRGKAQRATGARAADGSGTYVCGPATYLFEACDPGDDGEVKQYPLYAGRAAAPAPAPAAAAASSGATMTASVPASTSGVVAAARKWIGTPYRYGGTGRSGIDCSALVQNALREVGVNAPRTSRAQAAWATPISGSQARPGDLVFFYSPVSHVGIVIGGGLMIDAPRDGIPVGVRKIYPGARYGRVPA